MFEKTNGSRAEVWHGTAKKTVGGLTKSSLMKNKHGRIVSRRKHASGKRSIKHLEKLGYKATTTLEQGIPKFVDWFLKYYKHNEKN